MARVTIELTKKDIRFAKSLAKKRDAKKQRFGAGRYAACSDKTGSSEKSHYYGLLGEIAVAKFFDVEVDETIYDNHGDSGVDLEVPKFGRCQVKTTTYTDKPLLRVPMERKKDVNKIDVTDTFICCCINVRNHKFVDIVGWLEKDKVIKYKTRRFLRYGPLNYVVEESDLNTLNNF
tara:strand:+ start:108 stop:635 length:528 start_codon:yes stop_codon:yes gene_type:complete